MIILGLLGLSMVYFRDVLSGGYLFTERDLSVFFIPPRIFWVEAIKHFSLPLWNPYLLHGQPLIATLQPAVFYPLHVIYFLMPFDQAFNWIIVFHYFLAGLFTYVLMRKMRASDSASVIAAVMFMLSGYLLSVHNLLSTLLSVAWIPMVFLFYFAGFVKKKIRYPIFAALAAAIMFFAGGAIILYVVFLVIILLTAFPNLLFEKGNYPSSRGRAYQLGIFLAIFLGISAIQLLPFLELAHLSTRAHAFNHSVATTWSLHPRDLIQFFVPDLFGYKLRPAEYWHHQSWLKSLYLGSIPFLLSAVYFMRRGRMRVCLALLVLISLLLALGKYTPFYALFFNYVPFLDRVRYPVRFLFLTVFVISISAGLGYDRLKEGIGKGDNAIRRVIYGILALTFVGALLLGLLDFFEGHLSHLMKINGFGPPHYNDIGINMHNIKRLLVISIVFGLMLWIFVRVKISNGLLSLGVIGLLTFDLFFAHFGFYDKTLVKDYHKKSSSMDFILSDRSLFRVFVTPLTMGAKSIPIASEGGPVDRTTLDKEKLFPGYGLEGGIFDASGLGVMVEKGISDLDTLITTAPKPDSTNLLDMMNVKYVISAPEIKSPEFQLVWTSQLLVNEERGDPDRGKAIKIYQNLDCLPRAFLVAKYRVLSSEQEFKDILSSKEFNPREVVLLEEEPEDINYSGDDFPSRDITEKVAVREYRNNSISLRVSLPKPRFLFMSEMYYPGWKAYVDGEEKKIYRANYAFRAIALNPGVHQIEFIYRPWTFWSGLAISAATIIGLMVLGVVTYRKKRSHT
ncbi:MAG: YfhO family protein [Desulfobacteraceae bacterium]|nr:YfhO family protein [Desulfobacteraceae bacterium]